ncbi:MAG: EAL domain-containing protein [Lachnospiraceae bacterium]|nr:EAL domain-containing protein [Lachnospiraceae bacterium]MBP3507700.1 EAL domain-containing protein [Lachnospiraceae bacterium]
MSIKKSLQSSMAVAASIPIVIFALLAIWIVYSNYINVSKEAVKATVENYQKGFEAQLNTQIVEVESIATNNEIVTQLVKKYNSPDTDLIADSTTRASIHSILSQASGNFGNHVVYSVYDMEGTLVYSSNNALVGEYSHYIEDMSATLTKTQVNSTMTLNGMSNAIHIMTPISVKDKYYVGVMLASVDADYFGSFISSEAHTYLLDNASNSLLGIDFSNPKVQKEAVANLSLFTGDSNELSGTILIRKGLSFELYGYCIMPEYHWIYLVQHNTDMYQSLIRSIPLLMIIVLAIFLLLTFLTSSRLARKFCTPIFLLKEKMLQASKGDLNVHCEIESQDEFGELSEHFNDMMDIISNNYDELADTKEQLERSQEELKENYTQIKTLAYTDTLTGLANRVAFMTQAHEIFNRTGEFVNRAILFIDLDNFKNVNDTLGHDYGDILLKQLAQKLNSFMEDGDILARTGGDEFLVLKNNNSSTDALDQFASKLITIANHPFDLDGEIVHISMSVGVAIFPQNGLTVNELIKNADIAMYSAKTAGKSGYRFFDSSMEDEVNHKNEIEEILYNAIQNRELYLMYQPQCDMESGRIIGCEALMRLRNGYLGQIPPSEFIPIAEESGIINELGAWALEQACGFNKQLLDAGLGPITMSVNISMEQLKNPGFVNQVKSILEKTKMPAEYLELEVTESVLMQSLDRNVSLIQELRSLGIRIALDDFGTGYSSFNYLTQMPIDTLKMDKSFVDNISTNTKDCYIAETIISLAHKLNISVVAEGVEASDQLRILRENSCDILQGYLFSKPLPDEHYRNLLEINHS